MNFNDVTMAFGGWLRALTGERTPGSYVNGRWVDDTPTDLEFKGVVQNASADDLVVLPEGNRSELSIKIHTKFELIPNIENQQTGDKVFYLNDTYLVHNVAPRHIGGYFKAIALRL
jgi:hypothetical protein